MIPEYSPSLYLLVGSFLLECLLWTTRGPACNNNRAGSNLEGSQVVLPHTKGDRGGHFILVLVTFLGGGFGGTTMSLIIWVRSLRFCLGCNAFPDGPAVWQELTCRTKHSEKIKIKINILRFRRCYSLCGKMFDTLVIHVPAHCTYSIVQNYLKHLFSIK